MIDKIEIEKYGLDLLQKSLFPIPHELDELDWKLDLSDNSEKLKKHISAFANYDNGGFLAFGFDNDGTPLGIDKTKIEEIVNKIGNISRNSFNNPVSIHHFLFHLKGVSILLVYIYETDIKPLHFKNKLEESYIRNCSQTRRMSLDDIKNSISKNKKSSFETKIASSDETLDNVLNKLEYSKYFDLLSLNLPETKSGIEDKLLQEQFILKDAGDKYKITNFGALLLAKNIEDYPELKRKAVRVIIYKGINRLNTVKEQLGGKGYATGFTGLINYIIGQLPTNEVIKQALRTQTKMYPEIAIRELVANALIHQDFSIEGTSVMIEIFDDRIEITNPGKPLIDTNRFIDYPPRSRNELIAATMRRFNICEERGSGIDKVIFEVEFYQLPAPLFISGNDYTKVILYSHKEFSDMDKDARIRACYQHCCLKYVQNEKMTNQSLRQRFNISEKNYPMASRIISDTLETNFIKLADPENTSKKYYSYIPFWA
jgi:predicted HTH transcriptional regulator